MARARRRPGRCRKRLAPVAPPGAAAVRLARVSPGRTWPTAATTRPRVGGHGGRVRLGDTRSRHQEKAMLDADEARRRYVEMLTEKVRRDRFPSVTHMDRIEAALTPQTAGLYLEMLMEKISRDNYPSPTMLARVENVAAQLPRRPRRQLEDRREES